MVPDDLHFSWRTISFPLSVKFLNAGFPDDTPQSWWFMFYIPIFLMINVGPKYSYFMFLSFLMICFFPNVSPLSFSFKFLNATFPNDTPNPYAYSTFMCFRLTLLNSQMFCAVWTSINIFEIYYVFAAFFVLSIQRGKSKCGSWLAHIWDIEALVCEEVAGIQFLLLPLSCADCRIERWLQQHETTNLAPIM